MPQTAYNWKRFWCPRGSTIDLSDAGFLSDPDTQYRRVLNKDLVTLSSILLGSPCAILLGEPGMGKSHELRRAEEILTTQGHKVLRLDLGEYGNESELERDLFGSETFNQWLAGNQQLSLLLDSLDEGRMVIQRLAEWLVRKLRRLKRDHLDRLSLAIACRTAAWPQSFEQDLKEIWGDSVNCYALAPLCRKDVQAAAEANDIPPKTFLDAIHHSATVPLAIKPVTLEMLLRHFQQHGALPADQLELYRKGLLALCEETNDRRRDSTIARATDAQHRYAIARYLAAVMVLSNNPAIWTGSIASAPEGTLPLGILSGEVSMDNRMWRITEAMLYDTLNTGLFSARGNRLVSWAHRTYAEFLAAEYIAGSRDPLTLFKQLFVHDGHIVPQLEETAAWLAAMTRDVFDWILEHDPAVLLRGSVIFPHPSQKENLVDRALAFADRNELNWRSLEVRRGLSRLEHSNLAPQLRPYLSHEHASSARGLAIEIAEACRTKDLQNDLLSIALDISEETFLRKLAARAVREIADNETKAELKPLLDDPNDEDDELRGFALQALWPDHLTANELFEHLTAPKRSSFFGAYQFFLNCVLPERLRLEDLPIALEWVQQLPDYPRGSENRFEKLVDRIALLAWEESENPEVRIRFANHVLRKAKTYSNIFGNDPFNPLPYNPFEQDQHKRRMLVREILPHVQSDNDATRLAWCEPRLVLAQDVEWLLAQLAQSPEDQKSKWARLIRYTFNHNDPAHVDAILDACQKEPILAQTRSSV
ncbi:MAG: hypothetical protein D6704_13190, partial [Nitrospirae bacterium]